MHYQEFVSRVNDRIQAKYPGEAEYAIQATLCTLGEHLGGTEAEALAARLPAELEAQLASGNYAEAARDFSPEEFYRRVAARIGAPGAAPGAALGAGNGGGRTEASAEASADAVLAALSEALGGAESAVAPQRPGRDAAQLWANAETIR